MSDDVKYELIEYEGKPAKYYPQSGAIMQPNAEGKWVYKANTGGNPKMQDPEYARAMQRRRWETHYDAIVQGFIDAGVEMKGIGSTPDAIITAIVKRVALQAAREDTREGNEAAKIVQRFMNKLTDSTVGGSESGNSIKFELTKEQMDDVMSKIFKDE